ncbi:hypothetical protein [Klebsiella quasipneumoniae]|nr:hypothetical protein [Klebsiella quasipneumoniae]
MAPTQEEVHSNSVVDRWLSSASDADHSGKYDEDLSVFCTIR